IGGALSVGFVNKHNSRQELEVDLVNDSSVWGNDGEIPKCRLAPSKESVALTIALELQGRVNIERAHAAELIYLYRVVNYQLCRLNGIDQTRVAAQSGHGIAHGCQIHHRGHAGEITHEDRAGSKGNLVVGV